MMRTGACVTIGDQQFQCPPLTLGAIRQLTRAGHFEAFFTALAVAAQGRELTRDEQEAGLNGAVAIVSAALRPVDLSCTEEWLYSLPLTAPEIVTVASGVLAASGFKKDEKESSSPQTVSP